MTKAGFRDLALRVAYDGKPFSGFQLQAKDLSVQEAIEKALHLLFRKPIRIQFTSRTDAGVHAYDQWILIPKGLELLKSISARERQHFWHSLNSLLSDKIAVWNIYAVCAEFQVKKDVEWKEYHYRIINSPAIDPMDKNAWWIRKPLDLARMRKAQRLFVGRHDFRGFSKSASNQTREDTVRRILQAKIIVHKHPWMKDSQELQIRFRGEGFLHHMVRRLVGALVDIGRGENIDIVRILKSGDGTLSKLSAPPEGLFLLRTHINPKFFKELDPLMQSASSLL